LNSIRKFLVMLVFIFLGLILASCKNGDKIKVRLAEVTHSVFYAPQYVALKLGYFEEEGLDVELVLTPGADKVMSALLSRDVQIGLCGPEAGVFVYLNGQEDHAISFAQLTQRDGSFLVSRVEIPDWTWEMLKGKEILGGREGGMPEMTLEWVLKQKGLNIGRNNPQAEVNVRTDIQFAAMAGAFQSGEGDYTTLFEPTATDFVLKGIGYIVASIGAESGDVPYTAYHAIKSYRDKHPEVLQKFTNAIYKGQQWVKNHTAREIAETIITYFPELTINDLTIVTQRHIDIEAWQDTPVFGEPGYNRMLDIIIEAEIITTRPPYDKLIDNTFANKAIV
jgi:NitT/TauT family transport system substrate-binding protein